MNTAVLPGSVLHSYTKSCSYTYKSLKLRASLSLSELTPTESSAPIREVALRL